MAGVVHFEIPADNMSRADKFYSSVFGWKIEKTKGMEEVYHMAYTTELDKKTRMPKEPGAINGALMKRSDSGKHPVLTIDVQSIDETLKKIQKSGGKVLTEKQKVMDMGWYAYAQDTEGNVIGVWETIPRKM
jgi:predicted enzyme related to lactoylglutathione lyase